MISTIDQAREQSSILPVLVLYEIGLGDLADLSHLFAIRCDWQDVIRM